MSFFKSSVFKTPSFFTPTPTPTLFDILDRYGFARKHRREPEFDYSGRHFLDRSHLEDTKALLRDITKALKNSNTRSQINNCRNLGFNPSLRCANDEFDFTPLSHIVKEIYMVSKSSYLTPSVFEIDIISNYHSILILLLENGANPNLPSSNSPLHLFHSYDKFYFDYTLKLPLLLRYGLRINGYNINDLRDFFMDKQNVCPVCREPFNNDFDELLFFGINCDTPHPIHAKCQRARENNRLGGDTCSTCRKPFDKNLSLLIKYLFTKEELELAVDEGNWRSVSPPQRGGSKKKSSKKTKPKHETKNSQKKKKTKTKYN